MNSIVSLYWLINDGVNDSESMLLKTSTPPNGWWAVAATDARFKPNAIVLFVQNQCPGAQGQLWHSSEGNTGNAYPAKTVLNTHACAHTYTHITLLHGHAQFMRMDLKKHDQLGDSLAPLASGGVLLSSSFLSSPSPTPGLAQEQPRGKAWNAAESWHWAW